MSSVKMVQMIVTEHASTTTDGMIHLQVSFPADREEYMYILSKDRMFMKSVRRNGNRITPYNNGYNHKRAQAIAELIWKEQFFPQSRKGPHSEQE